MIYWPLPSCSGMPMTLRCPCGFEINGDGDKERSNNFREHLINEHEQDGDSLRMLKVREELGEDVTKALLSLEIEARAHMVPTTRTWEEVLNDSVEQCGGACISELPLTKDQLEDYADMITCPMCGKKVGGNDDDELSESLRDHCNGHEQLRSIMKMRMLSPPR